MRTEETDLIAHLIADNRKLRQLYLTEQEKALTERKRRIAAEARLAALLSKEIIERRKRNSSHCSHADHDLSVVDKTHKDLLKSVENADSVQSSNEDQTDLLVVNNIRKHRKKNSTSENVIGHTASSARTVQNINIAENNGKMNLHHNNFEKAEPITLSRFWSFIDKNGETKSVVPPPLNQLQQKRKEAFIRRSIERQILIKEASARRKELATAKRKVAKQLLAGNAVNRNAVQVLRLMDREIHAFPPQAMKQETIRRIYKTREFQDKKKRQREEYDVHINRLLAYCYSRAPYRLQRRTNTERS